MTISNAKINIVLLLLGANLLATIWLGLSTRYQIAKYHGAAD